MKALELYLIDCENKRRRMRDRPSDAVLEDLRTLLKRLEEGGEVGTSTSASEPVPQDVAPQRTTGRP